MTLTDTQIGTIQGIVTEVLDRGISAAECRGAICLAMEAQIAYERELAEDAAAAANDMDTADGLGAGKTDDPREKVKGKEPLSEDPNDIKIVKQRRWPER